MTILVFAKGYDGFVIASDRKESDASGQGNEVQKYCLSENGEFFLVLAGDGMRSQFLFTHLSKSDAVASNIIPTIDSFVRSSYVEYQGTGWVEGFLVIKNKNEFKFNTMHISRDNFVHRRNDSLFFRAGDVHAKLILGHLCRGVNFNRFSCEAVARHLLALVDSVAKTVSSVGSREDFGIDLTAFLNSGQILHRKRYTKPGEQVKISFELSDNKIFPELQNSGGRHE